MEPIAIIGIGCRFPCASNPESFWHLISNGLNAIDDVPSERWSLERLYDPEPGKPGKTVARKGGFLKELDAFDADFFEISEDEVSTVDPYQSLMLEVVWESLENAGIPPTDLASSRTGVFVGMSQVAQDRRVEADIAGIDLVDRRNASLYLTANRVSHFLQLQGPSLTIDTACSSSLVAVHLACQSLRTQECEVAIAGGIALHLSPKESIELSARKMLSSQGCCKTFDADADGYVKSEGCGVVVLKRLSDALQNHDNILAIIRGSAVNHNGLSQGIVAPNGLAQQNLIRQALSNAQVKPEDVSFVETHGTASLLGDAIEFRALKSILMEGRSPEQHCWLGSVKTNIGHLEAASGIAGLIKVILSMQRREIPPTIHLQKLNSLISLKNTAFLIPTERQSWNTGSERRIAGVSAFGIGGTNCHIILEEAPEPSQKLAQKTERPLHIFTLSAKTPKALKELTQRYLDYLKQCQDSVADICFSANTGRSHFECRLAIITESVVDLYRQLELTLATERRMSPDGIEDNSILTEQSSYLQPLNFQVLSQDKDNQDWPQSLQQLKIRYLSGDSIDWNDFDKDYVRCRQPLPTYQFQRQPYWAWQGDNDLPPSFSLQVYSSDRLSLPKLELQEPEKIHKEVVKPRTLAEETLAQIWANALEIESPETNKGKSNIDIYHNFFELGGHSSSAAHLLTQVQNVFQIDLPIHAFLKNPTLAGLSLEVKTQQQNNELSSSEKTNSWYSLVPLQLGGRRSNVFLVPGGSGDEETLMVYARLTYFLGQDFPVFGFKIDDWNVVPCVAETIASAFIKEMRKVQPEGPYILVGECIGGLIALEMAQQLRLLNQSVNLCILDTPSSKITKFCAEFIERFFVPIKSFLGVSTDIKDLKSRLNHIQLKLRKRLSHSQKSVGNKELRKAQNKHIKNLMNYRPRRFTGSLNLIISKHSACKNQTRKDWIKLGCDKDDIYEIDGDHGSYLGKYAQNTAQVLKSCLERIEVQRKNLPSSNLQPIDPVKD
jgi:acyl transferase domain-containing protein/CRISPR/Cas system-associated endoribonuclease Cas2